MTAIEEEIAIDVQHQTLGPTSSAFADIERRWQACLDENDAIELTALEGVRFGCIERQLLLKAYDIPGHILNLNGCQKTASLRESVRRAKSKLAALDLLSHYSSGVVELLPLGQKVVERYRRELETGKRIRWPR